MFQRCPPWGFAIDRDLAGPARPCKIAEKHRSELREIVAEKWQVDEDPPSMGRILKKLGLSRQKARPGHPKKNAEAAEALKKGSTRTFRNNPYSFWKTRALPGTAPTD